MKAVGEVAGEEESDGGYDVGDYGVELGIDYGNGVS